MLRTVLPFAGCPNPAKYQQLFTLIPHSHEKSDLLGGRGRGRGRGGGILRQAVQILYNIYIYIYYTGTETGLNIW